MKTALLTELKKVKYCKNLDLTNMKPTYGSPTVMIPKYSMMGPFRGHMSIKSSPFLPGSSASLSTQYIIQDHMATHYTKLLSAKAAVDTSTPKSLFTSVKFKDQQNKEKLIKAVEKYKKEIQQIFTSSHDSRSGFPEQLKPTSNHYPHHFQKGYTGVKHAHQFDGEKTTTLAQSPIGMTRDTMLEIQQGNFDRGYPLAQSSPNLRPTSNEGKTKNAYHDPQKKTYSGGDLLDKHAKRFTNSKQPFKPRLLKKSSQSFLSKYKYYKAPAKKPSANQHKQKSIQDGLDNLKELYRSLEDKNYQPGSISQGLHSARMILDAPSETTVHEEYLQQDQDLKYLQFLQDLTSDLVTRGCGSSKAMDCVFQDHLHRRNYDIDVMRKRLLVQELKDSLEKSEKIDFSISYDGLEYGSYNILRDRSLAKLLDVYKPIGGHASPGIGQMHKKE
uniref:Spermatogenesis-associated protein 7-like n=1 Tax=Leptobrachium leishanense TaxID=445787 RepID=A0A8C5MGB6_9ANUR